MIRTISSSSSSRVVCTTSTTVNVSTRPIVQHRCSPASSVSEMVRQKGSENASTARSNDIPCFLRFLRFLTSFHSKRIHVPPLGPSFTLFYTLVNTYMSVHNHFPMQKVFATPIYNG